MIDASTINTLSYSSSINVYWTPVSNVAGYNIYRSNNGENGVYQKLNKDVYKRQGYGKINQSKWECCI